MNNSSQFELSVYYDGLCPLCTKEMDHYRKKEKAHLIRFVDIAHPNFDAKSEGLNPDGIHKRFHAKKKNGEILTGVDAFIQIWEVMNIFSALKALASNPLTRPLFDFGYVCFAKVRPFFRKSSCDSDYCEQP